MNTLYIFGSLAAPVLGAKRFLLLYLISGTLGNVLWFFVNWSNPKIQEIITFMQLGENRITKSEIVVGSVHYLAPEIVRGEKATPQSDIYALGIIFYELLRGKVPFNDEAAINIALKHMREDMPSIRDFNPTISQGMENVILKATAKNLDDRYLVMLY